MMMKKKLLLLVLLFSAKLILAGKIERAFEALKRYDYFTAKEIFLKIKNKEVVAAPYGLSIIYGRNDNPFYNLDSAYYYIVKADSSLLSLELKEKQKLKELGVDSMLIGNWKDSIDKKTYDDILKKEEVKLFQAYIDLHIDSDYREEAIKKRNKLAFEYAKRKNSSEAYESFISRYPNAKEIIEAKNRFERRLYLEHTQHGKAADYNYFIKEYPQSPYVAEALDSVYSIYTKEKTEENYFQFVQENPKHPKVNEAWRNIYKLYTAEYSQEKILDFRIDYPQYPFVEELKQDMRLAAKRFLPFESEGSWGFMDEEGLVMIPPNYSAVEEFSEGLALVVKNDKVGYIDKSGKTIIPFEYEDGESFMDGLAIVAKSELYGMINRTAKAVIPLKYELVGPFKSGLALVANDTAYGYVNKLAEELTPIHLEYATDFENGFAVIELKGKKGMINTKGELVIPTKYEWIEAFNQYRLARAKNDSLYGILNQNGEEQSAFEYERIGEYGRGLSMIVKNGKYGYIDSKANMVIPLEFDFAEEALIWGKFMHGFAKFRLKNKCGIIDSTGSKVFPAIFEDVKEYHPDRLVAVKKRGKWGYTDESLKLIIPYQYDDACTFYEAKGVVKKDDLYGIIDRKGKYLLVPTYDYMKPIQGIGYVVGNEGKVGLLSKDLELLLELNHLSIKKQDEINFLRLEQEEAVSYYDLEKKKVIRPQEK